MDRILSLSAFGDVVSSKKPLKKNSNKSEQDADFSEVFSKILQNAAQSKLFHWQSQMYGQHKALDKLFEGLMALGDELAESIMGKYGRPVLSEDQLCLKLTNFDGAEDGDLAQFIEDLTKCYSQDCRSLFDPVKDSEIINILDEILSLIDKSKYLLSLK